MRAILAERAGYRIPLRQPRMRSSPLLEIREQKPGRRVDEMDLPRQVHLDDRRRIERRERRQRCHRLLQFFAVGNVLNRDQHLGLSPDVESGGGKQERDVLGFSVNGERQARFHLVPATTISQSLQDGAAHRAVLAALSEAAATRVIRRMHAAQCLAAAPPDQLGFRGAGELLGILVHFADAALGVHQQHDDWRVLVDRYQFLLVIFDCLLRPLPLGDVAGDRGSAQDSARCLSKRRNGQRHVNSRAIFSQADGLVRRNPFSAGNSRENPRHSSACSGGIRIEMGLPTTSSAA